MSESDTLLLLARVLMATLFIAGGLPKVRLDHGEQQAIASLGLPFPGVLELTTGLFQLACSGLLMFGIATRLAAALLAAFVVIVTPLFLKFWTHPDPGPRAQVAQAFFGNFGITAGLLALVAAGPGHWAIAPQWL